MIEAEGGKTLLLQTEEFFELARQMAPADFQALVADTLKAQAARIMTTELVCGGLVADIKKLQKQVTRLEGLLGRPGPVN